MMYDEQLAAQEILALPDRALVQPFRGIRGNGAKRSDWFPANGGRAIGMAHP